MDEMPVHELRARCASLLEERDRIVERCTHLEVALRDAIRDTTRVLLRRTSDDPASPTFVPEWTDPVRSWAALCHLDLTGMDPEAY